MLNLWCALQIPYRGRVRMTDPEWVNRVYMTQFKEPFYKGTVPCACICTPPRLLFLHPGHSLARTLVDIY